MLNQKEGVYTAIVNVLGFEPNGETVVLTDTQRKEVKEIITQGFLNDEIQMTSDAKAKYAEHDKMYAYVGGLLNNWLRKDTRLNGGDKYQPRNPGSRAGSGDKLLTELKKLLKIADQTEHAAIQAAIETRQNELTANKAKKIEIDMSVIPEELRHLIPQVG
jgi:hypothetical protein